MRLATFAAFALRTLCSLAVLVAADDAAAQRTTYRCSTDGRIYLSDKPCEGRPATALSAIGPTRDDRSTSYRMSSERSTTKAASYLGYLTPECSELNEGLRPLARAGRTRLRRAEQRLP